jgi:alkylation response protein AidB-like acyl-CoA dehydrogenase
MLYHASITLQAQSPSGPFDTFSLKALAIEAAQRNANTAVQIHGGMGYTQEMDIHLFVKRAQVLGTLFGSERFHLKKLLAERAPD